jgi:cold shock CspA family protein
MESQNVSETSPLVTSSVERLTGRVKWFNNKAGYGFITITDGTNSGSDVFVHHSAINVSNQQYKYLVQGEYVELSLVKTTSGVHEYQAAEVSGIKEGKLMCETRREFKLARNAYKSGTEPVESTTNKDVRQSAPKPRGEGPRESLDTNKWTTVPQKKPASKRGRPSAQNVVV